MIEWSIVFFALEKKNCVRMKEFGVMDSYSERNSIRDLPFGWEQGAMQSVMCSI